MINLLLRGWKLATMWCNGHIVLLEHRASSAYICAQETLSELQIIEAWALCPFHNLVCVELGVIGKAKVRIDSYCPHAFTCTIKRIRPLHE